MRYTRCHFFSQGYTEDNAPEVQNVQILALRPDIGAYNVVDTSQTVQCARRKKSSIQKLQILDYITKRYTT